MDTRRGAEERRKVKQGQVCESRNCVGERPLRLYTEPEHTSHETNNSVPVWGEGREGVVYYPPLNFMLPTPQFHATGAQIKDQTEGLVSNENTILEQCVLNFEIV